MKAYKLFDNQHKLNGNTECNNNNKTVDKSNNGKPANDHGLHSSQTNHLTNGDDKLKLTSTPTNITTTPTNNKRYNIENFLHTNVSSAVAAAETARNGFLAAAAAAQQYTPFNLFTPYLKDMFLAAQLIRGNCLGEEEEVAKRF